VDKRTASWYSIVRYCSNSLSGETINVGVILHSAEDKVLTKYLLIDEHSAKIKAITESQVEINTYKTFKDSLEYYLKKSIDNGFGYVGDVQIASPFDEKFLFGLYEYYQDKKLTLTKPKFSLTANVGSLFNTLFESYIGKKYLSDEPRHVSVKKYMRTIFEEKKLLDKKVAYDLSITPIKDLDSVKINIDFAYKNGVWNYLQALPTISGPTKVTDWFAKTKFMFENLDNGTKVHLLYRSSEISNKKEFLDMVNYLSSLNNFVVRLDLDDSSKIERLCDIIEKDAHDVDELLLA
jgi:hypothetical protein